MDELRDKTEPQEVVDWYVPPQGTEVVDYYVHSQPLPESVRPAPPTPPKKKKRTGLWIFLGIMGLAAVILVAAALLWHGAASDGSYDGDSQDNHDASSIVDIFADHKTTIPRVKHFDPAVRMAVTGSHGDELTAQWVYAQVNPATVLVVAQQGEKASLGTGIIMTEDGYVITNAHVISGGAECWVVLDTGMSYDAQLVGYDANEDIAVLKLVDAEGLPTAEFGNSDLAEVGDQVYAIGNPLGIELRCTMTDGILSAINRDVQLEGRTLNVLQTTAALNNGNSGGPLINRYGQVIGVNTLKMSGSGVSEATVEGLGFALPISHVCYVVNDIIATGSFRGVPALGVMVATIDDPDGGTFVRVESVTEGSPAADAGLQTGDMILTADGQSTATIDDLMAVRRGHIVGETMTLTLQRNGQTLTADVVLRADMG